MNDERWILATLKRQLIERGKAYEKENRYFPDWIEKVLRMIAEIESEAVLGAPTEEEIEEVE